MTLEETFTNEYTSLRGERLQVRSMKAEDIYNIIVSNELKYLYEEKYQKLFFNNARYFIINNNSLYVMDQKGDVYGNRVYDTDGIRPVVSLRSSVQANNKDMTGAWNIEV